ncbi:YqzL family protein [Paenibacillus sp. SYP-B4298]|nr:YqzL family protein [Paenibacillus sp. SYP-B4298]
MRNLSWTYFVKTGDVDAFMLYREICELQAAQPDLNEEAAAVEWASVEE